MSPCRSQMVRSEIVEPRWGSVEQVQADVLAAFECRADGVVVGEVHVGEINGHFRNDRQAALGRVGHGRERVDGRHLDREVHAADAGEVDGQHEKIRRVGEWWQCPREQHRERESGRRRIVDFLESNHLVLEAEHRTRVDIERQMEVDRAFASAFRVKIDFPELSERVGLDEVPLVVHVEAMVDRLTLHVGDETRYVDDCHRCGHYRPDAEGEQRMATELTEPIRVRGTVRLRERGVGPPVKLDPRDADAVLDLFGAICDRSAAIVATNDDWSMSGERETQYAIDVDVDAACVGMLHDAGLRALSEESGITGPADADESALVVVDPLDGSTNASLGLPWCATALCLVVDGSPSVAMVANLRTGDRFAAIVGRGATQNGRTISVGNAPRLAEAIVAVNARPPAGFRPAQYRSMGATALDIASVAGGGGFDASIDFDDDKIGVWDYLAAVTILHEAGGATADALGRDLLTLDHGARRRPVAAASPALLQELLVAADDGVDR